MELFEIGAHRGNSRQKLNPKLKGRVHSFNNDIAVINLVSTIENISNAQKLLKKAGTKKRQILIVGTSKHIANIPVEISTKFAGEKMPYVNNRWLGGTLTNWSTIRKTLRTFSKLESIEANQDFFSQLAKNEQLRISRHKQKIAKFFDGLKTLKNNRPYAVIVLDADNNPNAILEANLKKIPVIALTNTKAKILPTNLEHTIVCNTNSIQTISFIVNSLVKAYNQGMIELAETQTTSVNSQKEAIKTN